MSGVRSDTISYASGKKRYDVLSALAEGMLELNRHLAPIGNIACGEPEELLREISRTDKEI